MKDWEVVADNLKKRGWSLGYVSALDCEWRTIWIVDAHRDDRKRFIVHADEKLTAFLELEQVTRESSLGGPKGCLESGGHELKEQPETTALETQNGIHERCSKQSSKGF